MAKSRLRHRTSAVPKLRNTSASSEKRQERLAKWRKRFPKFSLSRWWDQRIVEHVCSTFRAGVEAANRVAGATGSQVVMRGGKKLGVQPLESRVLLAADVYVDDDWADFDSDFVIVDADPFELGDQPATFGVDAFATIGAAVSQATPGDTIQVNDGDYAGFTVNSDFFTIVAGGTDAEVTSASPALTVSGGAMLTVDGLTFTDNSDDGAPAILVTGSGSALTLSNSTVQEEDTQTAEPLIQVDTGATLNIDTANSGGNNIFSANSGTNVLSATTFIDASGTVNVDASNTLNVAVPKNTPFDIDTRLDGSAVSGLSTGSSTNGTVSLVSGVLHYSPSADYTGPASFNFSLTGGLSNETVNVSVFDTNDSPVITAPVSVSATEEAPKAFIDGETISIADVDAGSATDLTVELSVSEGVLDVVLSGVSISAGANNSPTMTLLGSLADLNATLASLTYTGHTDYFGVDTLEIVVNDGGNSGPGGAKLASTSADVNVANVDDTFTFIGDATTTVAEAGDVVITFADLDTDDPDGDTITYTLTALPNATTGNGSFSGGAGLSLDGGATFLDLGSNGTFTQADIGSLKYIHDGSETGGGADTFEFSVSDGTTTLEGQTFTIDITEVNNAPVITIPGGTLDLDEEEVLPISGISISDSDAGSNNIDITLQATGGTLAVTLAGSATDGGSSGSAILTLTGSQDDLNATLATLTYTGGLDVSGPQTITIDADDNGSTGSGGTKNAAQQIQDLNITAVNDEPTIGVAQNFTVAEGQQFTLNIDSPAPTLAATDPDNTEAELTYTVTTLPAYGELSLAEFTQADLDAGLVTYTHWGGEAPSDSFTVELSDGAGTGPVDETATITISVTQVNDTPEVAIPISTQSVPDATEGSVFSFTLDPGTFVDPDNSVVPGTDVLTLTAPGLPAWLNFDGSTFSGVPSNADVQAGSLSVTVIATDLSNDTVSDSFTITLININDAPTITTSGGTTTFTEDGGPVVVDAVVAVGDSDDQNLEGATVSIANAEAGDVLLFTDTSEITGSFAAGVLTLSGTATKAQYATALQSVEFESAGDDPVAGTRSLEFAVDDGDVWSAAAGKDVEVVAVNDDAVFSNNTPLQLSEGATISLSAAVGVVDPDDDPAAITVTVDSGPSFGTIKESGVPTDGTFTLAQLQSGFVTYTHDGSEEHFDSITLSVSDGGTPDSAVVPITITPINDPPTLVIPIASQTPPPAEEGVAYTFSLDPGTFDDAEDAAPPTLTAQLQGGSPLPAWLVFDGSTFSGTPDQDDVQPGSLQIEVIAADSNLATTSDSFTLVLEKVNDAPTVTTSAGVTPFTENTPVAVDPDVLVDDVDDTDLESAMVTIVNPEVGDELLFADTDDISGSFSGGVLTLSGTASVSAYQTALASVQFAVGGANAETPVEGTRTIEFKVFDGDANSLVSAATSKDVSVTADDDAPYQIANQGITIAENSLGNVIATSLLQYADYEGATPADITYTLIDVDIEIVELQLAGVGPITVGGPNSSFTQADIDSGADLTIDSFGNDAVAGTDQVVLTLNIDDGSGNVTSGVTFLVDITRVNDAPTITGDNQIEATEETDSTPAETTITFADLAGDDEEDANSTLAFKVESLPALGELVIDGNVAEIGDDFTQQDVVDSKIVYRHTSTAEPVGGLMEDSFDYTISDSGSGIGVESVSGTLNIELIEANDTPVVGGDLAAEVGSEDAVITIDSSDLSATDVDDVDDGLEFKIKSLPSSGELFINGTPAAVDSTFTQAQITANEITYDFDESTEQEADPFTDSFTFEVSDNRSGDPGVTAVETFNISITPIDDNVPTGIPGSLAVTEGSLGNTELEGGQTSLLDLVTDADQGVRAHSDLTVSQVNGSGSNVGVPVSLATGTLTVQADGTFVFNHNGNDTPPTEDFTFRAVDSSNESADITITISVTNVNDAPSISAVGATGAIVAEGSTTTIAIPGSPIEDPDAGIGDVILTISAQSGEGVLAATSGDVVEVTPDGSSSSSIVLVGTVAELNAYLNGTGFDFTADEDFAGTATLDFTINDGGNTGENGAQEGTASLEVVVTEVNDAPVIDGDNLIDLPAIDEDTSLPTLDVFAVTSPGGGSDETGQSFMLTAANLVAGMGTVNFDISNGMIDFTPDPNWFGPVQIEITVEDDGTTNGSLDARSATATIEFDVAPLDDAPTFTLGSNPVITEELSSTAFGFLQSLKLGEFEGESLASLTFDVLNVEPDTEAFTTLSIPDPFGNGDLLMVPAADVIGVFEVRLTITDGADGPSGTEISTSMDFEITVNNGDSDPPTAVDDLVLSVPEGGTFDTIGGVDGTFSLLDNDTDPDILGDATGDPSDALAVVSVTVGGTTVSPGTSIPTAHGTVSVNADGKLTYTHDGTENFSDQFTYTISDVNTGTTGDATVMIEIAPENDNPPEAIAAVDLTEGIEGTTVFEFDGTASTDADLPNDVLTYSWDFGGDGTATGAIVNHTFSDDGVYEVVLTVTDAESNSDVSVPLTITITDAAPTATLSGDSAVDEGDTYTLTIDSINDPGNDTVTDVVIDWGDGNVESYLLSEGPYQHVFTDGTNVPGDITVLLVNEDGFHPNAGVLPLTVNNVAPTGILVNGGNVNEGGSGQVFVVGVFDPGQDDEILFDYDFDNDGTYEVLGSSNSSAVVPPSFLADGGSADPATDQTEVIVGVRLRDDDGGEQLLSTSFTVFNVVPAIASIPEGNASINESFTQTITFSDPGAEPAGFDYTIVIEDSSDNVIDTITGTTPSSTRMFEFARTFTTPDTYTVSVTVDDLNLSGLSAVESFDVTVIDPDAFFTDLEVISATPTTSGIDLQFNQSLGTDELNLYSGIGGASADMTLTRNGVPVKGSLVFDDATNILSFAKTGGPLAAGNYTLTLKSGVDQFVSADGDLLLGNLPSGDFTSTFTVGTAGAVVSIPDFARGPGQDVDLTPGDSLDVHLPIRVSSVSNLLSLDVEVHYDPELLQLDAVESAVDGLSVFSSIDNVNGVAILSASSTLPLGGTNLDLIDLIGSVPTSTLYGSSQIIQLVTPDGLAGPLNEGTIPAITDAAVHKAVFVGDVDGSMGYNANDTGIFAAVVVGATSGFPDIASGQPALATYPLTDPAIVGDVSGNGALSGLDRSLIAQELALLDPPQVPDLPGPSVPLAAALVDPAFGVPPVIYALPGESIEVPVELDIESGASVYAAAFEATTDSTVVSFDSATKGSDWDSNWDLTQNEAMPGQVRIVTSNTAFEKADEGVNQVVRLAYTVSTTSSPGESTAVSVKPLDPNDAGLLWTSANGSVVVTHPGDYDRNGTVEQADYGVWKQDFGATTSPQADGNGDGKVSLADYVVWRNLQGASVVSAAPVSTLSSAQSDVAPAGSTTVAADTSSDAAGSSLASPAITEHRNVPLEAPADGDGGSSWSLETGSLGNDESGQQDSLAESKQYVTAATDSALLLLLGNDGKDEEAEMEEPESVDHEEQELPALELAFAENSWD